MPTYEYLCTSCKNQWEEVQKISEPALKVCPKCSKKTAQRQISAGNFILKGGGWYSDSYSSPKPSSKKDEGSGDSSSTTKDASDGSAKAEGKPAVTSDGKAEGKAEGKAKESAPPPKKTESTAPKAASGSSGGGKSS